MIDATQIAAKPEDLGIDAEKLEMVFARAKRDVDDGTLPSAQVAIARHGKLAGTRTFGSAVQGGAEKPATGDTLYHFFSSTKAVVSAAVWLLFEEGQLRLDEKVCDIVPEFGTNGKEVMDVETMFLMAGGFPLAPFKQDLWTDHDALLRAFSQWRLNWPVDSRYEYHATSMHWVLSEIILRRGGLRYKDFIRERITGPMGLDELFVGCPEPQQHRVADVCYTHEPVEPPGGWGEVTPRDDHELQQAERARGRRARRRRRRQRCDDGALLPAADQRRRHRGRHAHHEAGDDRVRDESPRAPASHRVGAEAHRPEPERQHEPRARRRRRRRRRHTPSTAASGGRARRAPSVTAAPAARSPGRSRDGHQRRLRTNGFADAIAQGRRVTAIGSLAANCLA